MVLSRALAGLVVALLGTDVAYAGTAEGLVRALEEPLRESVPEARRASLIGVRVLGTAPVNVREALTRALVPLVPGAVPLFQGDDLAGALEAARAAGVPRAIVLDMSPSGAGVASLHVLDPGPWFTFLAEDGPMPRQVARVPFEGPRSLLSSRPRTVPTPFRGVSALTLIDFDGDRRDELVLVVVDRVRVARLQGSSLAFLSDAPGSTLPRHATVPLRQPLGAAVRDTEHAVVRFRSSAHGAFGEVRFIDGAVLVRALDVDLYPVAGLGCAHVSRTAEVDGLSSNCDPTAIVPVRFAALPAAYGPWQVRAITVGSAEVLHDGVSTATLTDVAAPFVLDDLDGDGTPELLTASASPWGRPDRVRVFSLEGRVRQRVEVTVPGAVEALGVGDLDGDGQREIVASVSDSTRGFSTLWIVR